MKTDRLKIVLVILVLIITSSIHGQTSFMFEDEIVLENTSHQDIFKRAINWHTGSKRTEFINIKYVYTETDIWNSRETVTYTNENSSFLQTSLNILITKPELVTVSFTVKLEMTNGKCEYSIDNFYYRLKEDRKDICYQYIDIMDLPPEECRSTWGLIFYKKSNTILKKITKEYVETYLIPDLKIWLNKKE